MGGFGNGDSLSVRPIYKAGSCPARTQQLILTKYGHARPMGGFGSGDSLSVQPIYQVGSCSNQGRRGNSAIPTAAILNQGQAEAIAAILHRRATAAIWPRFVFSGPAESSATFASSSSDKKCVISAFAAVRWSTTASTGGEDHRRYRASVIGARSNEAG